MKWICLGIILAFFGGATAQALTIEQAAAIRATLASAATAELPAVAAKILRDATPADMNQTRVVILKAVATLRPGALAAVQAAVNRPPITPGNINGQRPVVPPGLEKHDYGRP